MMQIQHSIKTAFDCIQADEALKNRTKRSIMQTAYKKKFRSHGQTKRRFAHALYAACVMCIMFLGYHIYFTSTSTICIDFNPSVELDINRFDRVIDVRHLNQDGAEFASSLNVFNKSYRDAIRKVLDNQYLNDGLQSDELLSFAVVQNDETQGAEILNFITEYTKNYSNIECYGVNSEYVLEAHSMGLSYGRYKYYLEIIKYDPSVIPEQLNQMSMREIRELLYGLSDGEQQPRESDENGNPGGRGNGYRHGKTSLMGQIGKP